MKVAQELYEGVEIPDLGAVGLITYMRTDSLRISNDAIAEVTEYIKDRWGEKYLPKAPRVFKSRANAQDGHEAIRPSMPSLAPEQIKGSLTNDQYKLYKLIWERFTACQMAECVQKQPVQTYKVESIFSRLQVIVWILTVLQHFM